MSVDYLLHESPVGYAVFKVVLQPDTIGSRLAEVQKAVQDLDKFGKTVELVGLAPFQGTQDALQEINDISEGILSDFLRATLETNLPKAGKKKTITLGISEKNLAGSIKAAKKVDKKANRVSIPVPKVTEAELQRQREEERLQIQQRSEAAKKRQSRTADEEEYERMVLIHNTNRDDSLIEAHSVEDALAHMTVETLPTDRHPERRLKASFKAFEEAELPKLKEEKPGLTLTQYKDMIWKLWKKSPDNPLNQVQVQVQE